MAEFLRGYAAAWQAILRDRTAVMTLLLAAIVYAFYYPAAYRHQVASRIPVVVADLDRGPMSRDLVRRLHAIRDIDVRAVVDSIATGRREVERGAVEALLVIDAGFERAILRGDQGRLSLIAAGSLLGRASTALQGLSSAIAGFSRTAVMEQARFAGSPLPDAIAAVQRPLFNTREGYASSVVAGVAILIVHQTLIVGMGVLIGGRRADPLAVVPGRRRLAGALTAFWTLGMLNLLFYAGFVFWLQDYPRAGNLPGLLVAGALFIAAAVAFGLFIGSLLRAREHALQLVVMTSMPVFFLSGLPWPRSSMPTVIAWLADLLPTTPGIIAMVKVNQMGASLAETMPELVRLLALTVLYGGLAAVAVHRARRAARVACAV